MIYHLVTSMNFEQEKENNILDKTSKDETICNKIKKRETV